MVEPVAFTRRPTPGVRVLLLAFCCLTAAAVVSLVGLAARTDETFAWTIEPPVTAAFLGSGYAAGLVLSALSLRADDWAVVRVPFVTVLVFTWLTAAATFVHLDRLHMRAPGSGPVAEPAAWLWLVVYVAIPVGMAVLLTRQGSRRAARPPAVTTPRPLTAALVVQGAVLLLVGAALFVVPASAEVLWPWTLTPFTARVVAAWLLAFAVAVALAVADGDLRRLRVATVAYTAFGAFQLVTLVRFRGTVEWARAPAWVLVAMLVAVVVTGAVGWALGGRGAAAGARGRRS
ncbi:hypothetical protein [uncultured Cellulomonas sp.]|uniref:hypothetical protein n=1 Tax=uncultured Cellulomonas sp. TaxID=189682 RepID=UPI00263815E5|nr:hypothetical protein [uncultured Cellulomonas sp.]